MSSRQQKSWKQRMPSYPQSDSSSGPQDTSHNVNTDEGEETPPDERETPLKTVRVSTLTPSQTNDRAPHEADLERQRGAEMVAGLSDDTCRHLIEDKFSENGVIIHLRANTPRDGQPDESHSLTREAVRKFGEPTMRGVLQEICQKRLNLGNVPTIREGCIELLFDTMTADEAQQLLTVCHNGQLKDVLTKIVLGEAADSYHLELRIAEHQLQKLAMKTSGLLITHDWKQLTTSDDLLDTTITEAAATDYQTHTFPIKSVAQLQAFVSGKLGCNVPRIKGCPLQFLSDQVIHGADTCSEKPFSAVVKVVQKVTHNAESRTKSLSPKAVTALHKLEEKLQQSGQLPYDDVENFLLHFGSHSQCGTHNLGKCFSWMVVADVKCNQSILIEVAEEIFAICEKYEAYVPASKEGIWYDPATMVNMESWGEEKKQVLESVRLLVAQWGCSAEKISLQKWKNCTDVNQVKRLHDISSSIVPTWDLISEARKEFPLHDKLALLIKENWDRLVQSSHQQETEMAQNHQNLNVPKLENWNSFAKEVGMEQHFTFKLQPKDVRSLKVKKEKTPEVQDLPWTVLEDMMLMNSQCREDAVTEYAKNVTKTGKRKFGAKKGNRSTGKANAFIPHPMDLVLLLFTCSNFMLKQMLTEKLFICRLAIPFIVPTIDGTIEVLMWPLRTIVMEWRKNKQAMEESLVHGKYNMIAFKRYGQVNVSKSKMMNNILSPNAHSSFFHREASCGKEKRLISDGTVELSHYLPADSKRDNFSKPALFFNLRGDACGHLDQSKLLMDLATVIVIFVDIGNLDTNEVQRSIRETVTNEKKPGVVFVLTDSKRHNQKKIEQLQERFSKLVGNAIDEIEVVTSFEIEMDGKEKIITEVNREVIVAISSLMSQNPKLSLDQFTNAVDQYSVDEKENLNCVTGKKLAMDCMAMILKLDIDKRKQKLLPRQADFLHEIGILVRRQHREASTIEEGEKYKQDIISIKETKSAASTVSSFMQKVIKLFQTQSEENAFAIRWLQLELDATSRSSLPQLHSKKTHSWNELMKAQAKGNVAMTAKLQEEVHKAEKQIVDSACGLEHLIREMAQLYDVSAELKQLDKKTVCDLSQLPDIVSKLLLEGHPIEVLDGDHGFIPIHWIKAVFHSLAELVGQDKKIFVVSIMGIQSSGKSTLLNAMFGLTFAVSAGRCTRGIYAQLLPVADRNDLPFDYMLVLDSEGLRAQELGQENFEHDNELATLVIGMADLALVNMKGENPMEITDILQIVLHAFLRMKLADSTHQRQCIFIHQNVGAVNAPERLAADQQKFHGLLDKITRQASEAQGLPEMITSFSRIIQFDGQHDIVYFPDLWDGNPPMSSINELYSMKAAEIQQRILKENSRFSARLTISDFVSRLIDMWNGMLADDFVFSFRNSLAAKVYLELEREYSRITMSVEEELLQWVNCTCNIKIQNCENEKDLHTCCTDLIKSLKHKQDQLISNSLPILQAFIVSHSAREVIIQWKREKELSLNMFGITQEKHMATKIDDMKTCKLFDLRQKSTSDKHEQEIEKKAALLAKQLRGAHPSSENLERQFDALWNQCVHQLVSATAQPPLDVTSELERILWDIMKTGGNRKFLEDQLRVTPLVACEPTTEISKQHITKYHIVVKDVKQDSASAELYVEDAAEKATAIMKNVMDEVDSVCKQDIMFDQHHGKQTIGLTLEEIATYNKTEGNKFAFTPQFTAMLVAHVARCSIGKFEHMNRRFEERNGLETKMKNYKQRAFLKFKNRVQDASTEVSTSDDFCEVIKVKIREHIMMQLDQRVLKELYDNIGITKYDLITVMLDEIVETENFDNLQKYIKKPVEYAETWLKDFGEKNIFTQHSGQSKYSEYAAHFISKMIKEVVASTEAASRKAAHSGGTKQYSIWIQEFLKQTKLSLPLDPAQLKVLSTANIKSIENYQKLLASNLEKLQTTLEKEFQQETPWSVKWFDVVSPFQKACKRLWGCPELCPFCREPCQHSDPRHTNSHRCIHHRPSGVRGVRTKDTGVLGIGTCNTNVASTKRFNCEACNKLCRKNEHCKAIGNEMTFHYYRNYKKHLPNWDIAPDSCASASKFWQWAMYTFQDKLQNEYSCKTEIPASWKDISKQEARHSLRVFTE